MGPARPDLVAPAATVVPRVRAEDLEAALEARVEREAAEPGEQAATLWRLSTLTPFQRRRAVPSKPAESASSWSAPPSLPVF